MRCKHTRNLLQKREKAWENRREGREVQERVDKEEEKNLELVTSESEKGDVGVLGRNGGVRIIKF